MGFGGEGLSPQSPPLLTPMIYAPARVDPFDVENTNYYEKTLKFFENN